jgi:hypothetical protein
VRKWNIVISRRGGLNVSVSSSYNNHNYKDTVASISYDGIGYQARDTCINELGCQKWARIVPNLKTEFEKLCIK